MALGDVLFTTDFSAASEPAGLLAREMARQQGLRLHIVHVVPPVTDPAGSAETLARLAAGLGEGLRVETAVLSGRVAHQIIRYARDKGIGLIVLGTHGRTGMSRALLGSVAGTPRTVATEAPAPHRCIVCAEEAEELICETCRTRIRGEMLEQKLEAERQGRRGSPV